MENEPDEDAHGFIEDSDTIFMRLSKGGLGEPERFDLIRGYVRKYGERSLPKIVKQICAIGREEGDLPDLQKSDPAKYQYCRALAFGLMLNKRRLSEALLFILKRFSLARKRSPSGSLLGDDIFILVINLIARDKAFESFKNPKRVISAIEGPGLGKDEKRLAVLLAFVTNTEALMGYLFALPEDSEIRRLIYSSS